jgi:phage shock protein C
MDITPGTRRLYRSSSDKRIAGVLGGIAEFFQIDAPWVRLGFVILFFLFMILSGFLLPFFMFSSYGIAWFIIPPAPQNAATFSLNKNF